MDWPGRAFVLAILCVPLFYLIGGLLLYAVLDRRERGRRADPRMSGRGASAVLGMTVRQGFAWTAGPIERALSRSGASPDLLTMIGLVATAVGAFVIAAGDLLVGGLIVLGAAGFDYFDGLVARARGGHRRAGEFLDSTADRWSDLVCFGAAAFLLRDLPWLLVASLAAMGAGAIVSYTRAKAASLGIDVKVGTMQRAERIVLYSVGAWISPLVEPVLPWTVGGGRTLFAAVIVFVAVATTQTAVRRSVVGYRELGG